MTLRAGDFLSGMTTLRMGVVIALLVTYLAAMVLVAVLVSHRRAVGDSDSAGDEIDDSAVAVLSMLDEASIVLNAADEVLQASPAAYRMGIVADDAVVDERVREMVSRTRADGGVARADVTTWTPERFMEDSPSSDDSRPMPHGESSEASESSGSGGSCDSDASVASVARRNWLRITVSMISDGVVVVLIDDVSERVRFAQMRDSFIENVSEQLVEPARTIETLAASIESGKTGPDEIKAAAGKARGYASHLKRMMADLLLLIKAQEPVLPSADNRMPLLAEVTDACDACEDQARRYGISLAVEGDDSLVVNGDRDQIRTAIMKLVDNAILYSPTGSTVSVSVAASRSGDRALVRVIDRGVGIDKNESARVFERFFRGSNQNDRTSGGIGLGLAIVKHVSLTHHGSVSVWSTPGEGSTFTMSLPLAA